MIELQGKPWNFVSGKASFATPPFISEDHRTIVDSDSDEEHKDEESDKILVDEDMETKHEKRAFYVTRNDIDKYG